MGWIMSQEHSTESHKEKREHSKEHKGTNNVPPLEQHNGKDMKDNLMSIMSVVCPDHSSVKKCAHKTCQEPGDL